jgi:hypothetical protein
LKLAAHQGHAHAQNNGRICFQTSKGGHQSLMLLNQMMGIVWRMLKVFELILTEEHIVLNFLLIKELLLVTSVMGLVPIKSRVFQVISKEQQIIADLLLIRHMLLFISMLGLVCIMILDRLSTDDRYQSSILLTA